MDSMNHPKPQPPRPQLPRGLEVLIKKSAVDPEFRALMLERRAEAADTIGLELTAAETAMLAAIPREQLETIIAQTEVPSGCRRIFLGTVAAAMLGTLGALGLLVMVPVQTRGISPDRARRIRREMEEQEREWERERKQLEEEKPTTATQSSGAVPEPGLAQGSREAGPPPRPAEANPDTTASAGGMIDLREKVKFPRQLFSAGHSIQRPEPVFPPDVLRDGWDVTSSSKINDDSGSR